MSQRILVVEDGEDLADLLRAMLESVGYEVQVAYSSMEALEMVETSIPDVAVIDIGLPGMNGNGLARRLRSSSRTAHCRLVAMTGYGGPDALAETKAAGFDVHLVKPAEMGEILLSIGP